MLFVVLTFFFLIVSFPPLTYAAAYTNLESALTEAAGIYKQRIEPKFSKTVFITAGNFGYLNHFHNHKCFLDRLDIKFLAVAMDRKMFAYFTALSLKMNMTAVYWTGDEHILEESTTFRSKQFNIISNLKMRVVLKAIELGYDVVFSDPDIAIVRNPMPHLQWKNVDYIHSLNMICPRGRLWDFHATEEEGNTGFYFVRSNNRTIQLFNNSIAAVSKWPEYDDQSVFWMTIRSSKAPPIHPLKKCAHAKESSRNLTSCPLDACEFSVGALRGVAYTMLRNGLVKSGSKMITLHANYMKGNLPKQTALAAHGLWLATKSKNGDWSGGCQSFKPPM